MKNYYSINEVANMFDITANKIRHYEKKGLLAPLRNVDNEYRKFTEEDIMKLQAILLYRSVGLTIKDIKDIMLNNNSSNYLNHFNREWQIVSNEIDRLNVVRNSLESIIDNIYESDECKADDNILDIIKSANELSEIKNSWKDRWDFNSWADSYDESVMKDKGALKIYENYNLILENVYNLAVSSIINDSRILEIGVGTGNLAGKFLENDYDIVGIDQSREMLRVAKEKYPKLKVRLGEFLKIPYSDKCFDIIVSTYAFHHLNNDEKSIAIREMLRVLRNNGKIIIGDLMFKDKQGEINVVKRLSKEQIDEVRDEYYSYIDFLEAEFSKFNKELKYKKIDEFNYIIEVN